MNFTRFIFGRALGRRLPTTSGNLTVPGLTRPVVIRRDGWGIPHITAENEPDVWYGLGFCQGQDRAFQLEAFLRVGRGTVAELAGPDAVPIDRISRRIGFYRSAQQQLQVLSEERRQALEAFARGVAAGEQLGLRRRPHEFVLLRRKPTPWTAADALAAGKLHSCLLGSSWDIELARLRILTEDGPEALAALDPSYPAGQPVSAPSGASAGDAIERLAGDLALFAAAAGAGGCSNNWALSPTRTAGGRPLLACDPHLRPALPAHWYLCHLQAPEWSAAGACYAGIPAIAAGHNGVAAWGLTAGCVDNADLFLEEVGTDGRSVRQGGEFVPCAARVERIDVKGAAPVIEEVLETPRGPIISPALDGETRAISLRAVWLDALPVEGLLGVHRAQTFEEFRRCFAAWPGPSLNMAYADTSGTVGWQLTGQAPRRRAGLGSVPLPGWQEGSGWEVDLVPFDEMPFDADPAGGFVATANNRPLPAGQGPYLGEDWIDGYRLARIVEQLGSRSDWDVEAVLALQLDQESLPWREIRDVVLAATPETEEVWGALGLMEEWDGVMSASSPAATVFELFCAEMALRLARAKAPRSYRWALSLGPSVLMPQSGLALRRMGHLARLLREQPPGWFERSWPEESADALAMVVAELRSKHGEDPTDWAWGAVRTLTLEHPLGVGRAGGIFNLGPFPWGGDTNTVGQASVDPLEPLANPGAIASLRMVVDVGAWERSRFVLPGGQSGNPYSPHYADQLPLWKRGDGIPIAWSEAEVQRATRSTLRLVPQRV